MKNYKRIITHKYASELNQLEFKNGSLMNCKGLTNIKDIRKKYFKKLEFNKYALITFGDRIYNGTYKDYKQLKEFINNRVKYHCTENYTIKLSIKGY